MSMDWIKKGRIAVYGSIVHDLVSYTPRFPKPGESIRGTSFFQSPGGKGANQAAAAAKLGAAVSFIGMVGEDIFGDTNMKGLQELGVDVYGVGRSRQSSTGTATITVNEEGENCIVVTLGANEDMTVEVAERHADVIRQSAMVVCQSEVPQEGNRRVFEIARLAGVTTFFNPAPADPGLDRGILELVDILCMNENEAESLGDRPVSSMDETEEVARSFLLLGPKIVIITLGVKGCLVASAEESFHVEALSVKAIDTTSLEGLNVMARGERRLE